MLRVRVHWDCISFKLTADRVLFFSLDRRLKSSYYFEKEKGKTCRCKILAQVNPCHVVDFPSNIILVQSSLEKSQIYCTCNFCNLCYTYNGYDFLKSNWKEWQNHTLKYYMLIIDHMLSLWSKKNKSFFSFMVNFCNQEVRF